MYPIGLNTTLLLRLEKGQSSKFLSLSKEDITDPYLFITVVNEGPGIVSLIVPFTTILISSGNTQRCYFEVENYLASSTSPPAIQIGLRDRTKTSQAYAIIKDYSF